MSINKRGNRSRVGKKNQVRRASCFEHLETRRLLIGEGEEFSLARTFDTTGLVGSLSSTIRWGDGTESAGTVVGTTDNNGPISIRFEYVGSFFNDPARRVLLNQAASSIIERFGDDLAAISPGGILEWTANTQNPATGAPLSVPNLSVGANELVIYVGGRDLPGNRVGEAGPGGFSFAGGGSFTSEQIAQIESFRETVQFRGETGASLANPTDYSAWGGSIAFDSLTNWHFGNSTAGLDDDEVDFASVAAHELLHVLGFGVEFVGAANSSYEVLRNGSVFTGPNAVAEFGGAVPLSGTEHFSETAISRGQVPLINPSIPMGERLTLTPLDLAALDDIGWTIRDAPNATVNATHVYADNPDDGNQFPVEVILRGSQFGDITQSITATVTNTPPTLTGPGDQTVQLGDALSVTNIVQISDPGFRNTAQGSAETFDYVINWGDGSDFDTGQATIDRFGTATADTLASLDATHVYDRVGSFNVIVTVTDDDGGVRSTNFNVTVTLPPVLILALSRTSADEDAGADAATLTVTRSGPATTTAQTITLTSDDTTEAVLPASITIQAGATSATAQVRVVDDTLLDGSQTITFSASGTGVDPDDITFNVLDVETIDAVFASETVLEDANTTLRITRSNTDGTAPLTVNLSGGNQGRIPLPTTVEIPAGQQSVTVPIVPADNSNPEPTLELSYTIAAAGYPSTQARISLLDDEPPLFQNQDDPLDVDGTNGTSPLDAILIINFVALNGFGPVSPSDDLEFLLDVNGDYQVNAVDAIIVINFLADQSSAAAEQIDAFASQQVASQPIFASGFLQQATDDDTEDENPLDNLLLT